MEVEKQEYIHIKMHRDEAERFVLLLQEMQVSTNTMPDWAKAQSIEHVRRLAKAINS